MSTEKTLERTTVKIDPVGVIYNVQKDDIESFVDNYLRNIKGIDTIGVRAGAPRTGNRTPEVVVYAFFDQRSKDVVSKGGNIDSRLRDKIDFGGYHPTKQLADALKPLAKDYRLETRDRMVYVKLNVFRVLGLMLGANPQTHQLQVTEVMKLKHRGFIATVFKMDKFIGRDESSTDRLSSIIDRVER